MLRAPSGLKRSVVKWVSQVSVSVGATLVATVIYGALPKPGITVAAVPPEMTSGGKFAARAEPASTIAYDGLDTMPLPHVMGLVAPAAFLNLPGAIAAEPSGAAGPLRLAVWDAAGPGAAPDRAARKAAKPSVHGEARRSVVSAERPQPISLAAGDQSGEGAKDEDGWLPKVMSTARTAWSMTASTGTAVLSRLTP